MITIIDYKVGNPLALKRMIEKVGDLAVITSDIEIIKKSDKLILPGVGTFNYGMKMLENLNLIEVLNNLVLNKKVPILGICLGMQLMALSSEEGSIKGLGWLPYRFLRFDNTKCKVPHMGWNYVDIKEKEYLYKDMDSLGKGKFYFDHSYYLKNDEDDKYITATSNHSFVFGASVRKDNIFGVQFHPEKSLKYGIQVIKNFKEL